MSACGYDLNYSCWRDIIITEDTIRIHARPCDNHCFHFPSVNLNHHHALWDFNRFWTNVISCSSNANKYCWRCYSAKKGVLVRLHALRLTRTNTNTWEIVTFFKSWMNKCNDTNCTKTSEWRLCKFSLSWRMKTLFAIRVFLGVCSF